MKSQARGEEGPVETPNGGQLNTPPAEVVHRHSAVYVVGGLGVGGGNGAGSAQKHDRIRFV